MHDMRADRSAPSTSVTTAGSAASGDRPALVLESVCRRFGAAEVLGDVDLTVQPGEVVALLGPSGSGKTTLLAIAGGLLRPSSGRARILGDDIYDERGPRLSVARRSAFILQAASAIPFLTVAENLLVRRVVHDHPVTRADRARARELLALLDLEAEHDRLPNRLSGGERQRVCVAAALFTQAPLILADEPTASLDRRRGRTVMELLAAHAHTRGAAVIAATHDERALDLADRVVAIEDGTIRR